jgi:hypothetical protein
MKDDVPVIPAEAGIQTTAVRGADARRIPAFAGMTVVG